MDPLAVVFSREVAKGLAEFIGIGSLGAGLLSWLGAFIRRRVFAEPDFSLSREDRKAQLDSLGLMDRYRSRMAYSAWSPASRTIPSVFIAVGIVALLVLRVLAA